MSPPTDHPNVLLICTDHWPGLLTRPNGHRTVMTPTLERFSRNGVCFTNMYSACPVCIPARRSLMTGMSPRGHGVRTNSGDPMPDAPTLAQVFDDAGYQTFAVGKLHVNPQRNRIGFNEVILNEEGRRDYTNRADDWELYLADHGYPGMEQAGGLAQNDYLTRAWHLPESCHPTNWAVREMCRAIYRRDPDKPAFWYLSFIGPHPPIWPPQAYVDLYRDVTLDPPVIGEWAREVEQLPHVTRERQDSAVIEGAPEHEMDAVRRAFYATMTHIDHQIRLVVGTLKEQGIIDNTIIAFTSDHGDMLGDHRLWSKALFYEMSARVPLIIQPHAACNRMPLETKDDRITDLQDIMPTLLDLAGVPIPKSVEGISLATDETRDYLFGEYGNGADATRMIRHGRYKLIYYPAGNRRQLFDISNDPREMHDLADSPNHADALENLTQILMQNLYGEDQAWILDDTLTGLPDVPYERRIYRDLFAQRGLRFV